MSVFLNSDNIVNFLTLRYDPTINNLFNPLKSEDFMENKIENIDTKITEIVKSDLELKLLHKNVSRISLALSGGIDSGFTLLMIRKFFPNLQIDSICVGFGDEDDEITKAKVVAEKYDCNFHELIVDNVLADLPKLISIAGEPRWNLYQYYTLEQSKKYSPIFFSGDGGDETFAGYIFRYKKFLQNIENITSPTWLDKSKIFLSCHERDWVPNQDDLFNKNLKFSWLKIYENFKPYFDNDLHPINQVLLADFNGKLLHDWIPSNHKFGKYLKIEINSLFLNPQLITLSANMPWNLKYDYEKDIGKLPLLSILNKYSGVNKFEGIKKGFSLNLLNMWKNYGKEIIITYLNKDADSVKENIINLDWIDESIKSIDGEFNKELKIRYISKLLSVLSFEIWYRIFVTCTLNANTKL
ncbi:MAG: asparagine synthase [Nitrosopumilus sp.]|nr:asparagine synthase [Nitrosopumilus sp.]